MGLFEKVLTALSLITIGRHEKILKGVAQKSLADAELQNETRYNAGKSDGRKLEREEIAERLCVEAKAKEEKEALEATVEIYRVAEILKALILT